MDNTILETIKWILIIQTVLLVIITIGVMIIASQFFPGFPWPWTRVNAEGRFEYDEVDPDLDIDEKIDISEEEWIKTRLAKSTFAKRIPQKLDFIACGMRSIALMISRRK